MLWQRKSHQKKQYGNYLQVSTVDSMKEIPWEELQSMIDSWARDLDDVVKVLYGNERRYAMEIFGEPVSIACFVDIAKPEFQKFMRFGSNFLKIEPSFERIFPLLDMFASLEKSGPMICHLFAGPPCEEILSQYLDLLSKVINFVFWPAFYIACFRNIAVVWPLDLYFSWFSPYGRSVCKSEV